jgi:hypothetical protein
MNPGDFVFLIPIAGILGGISVAIAGILAKSKIRQLEIRERIAMIEKGLVPPPEVDPGGFDQAMDHRWERRYSPGRHRRVGTILIGVGVGLMLLIGLEDNSLREGLGVGGFFVVLGLAFFVNSLFDNSRDGVSPPSLPRTPTPPATR